VALQGIARVATNPKHKDYYKANQTLMHQIVPPVQHVSGEIHHTHELVDHDAEAMVQIRMLQNIGITEEKLVGMFGVNGLARYRRMITAEDNAKAAAAQIVDADFRVIEEAAQPVDPDADLFGE
jgi:hypothetical protein